MEPNIFLPLQHCRAEQEVAASGGCEGGEKFDFELGTEAETIETSGLSKIDESFSKVDISEAIKVFEGAESIVIDEIGVETGEVGIEAR